MTVAIDDRPVPSGYHREHVPFLSEAHGPVLVEDDPPADEWRVPEWCKPPELRIGDEVVKRITRDDEIDQYIIDATALGRGWQWEQANALLYKVTRHNTPEGRRAEMRRQAHNIGKSAKTVERRCKVAKAFEPELRMADRPFGLYLAALECGDERGAVTLIQEALDGNWSVKMMKERINGVAHPDYKTTVGSKTYPIDADLEVVMSDLADAVADAKAGGAYKFTVSVVALSKSAPEGV